MTSIRERIVTEGTIPILSSEGINALIKHLLDVSPTGIYGYDADGQSRNLKLSTFKPPIDEPDDRQVREECEKRVFETFKAKLSEMYMACGKRAIKLGKVELSPQQIEEVLALDSAKLHQDRTKTIEFVYSAFIEIEPGAEHMGKDFVPEGKRYKTKEDKLNQLNYDYKIYINTPSGKNLYLFFEQYFKKCIERGIPYDCKPGFNAGESIDRTSLYIHEEDLDAVLEILEEIKQEHPEITSACGSPMASALNYSYYAIVDKSNRGGATYNNIFDDTAREALYCTIAMEILQDNAFYQTLTKTEQNMINVLAGKTGFEQICENMTTKFASIRTASQQQIIGHMIENNYSNCLKTLLPKLIEYIKQKIEQGKLDKTFFALNFVENLRTIASIKNFGDRDHLYGPICLREAFFENSDVNYNKAVRISLEDDPETIRRRESAKWRHDHGITTKKPR